MVDTGKDSMTGGRIKEFKYIGDQTFLLTYGDGVSNVNIDLVSKHTENDSALLLLLFSLKLALGH